jgi:hypothetical protein
MSVLLKRAKSGKGSEVAVAWVLVAREDFYDDAGRLIKAGVPVSRDDPAVKLNPQFFIRREV